MCPPIFILPSLLYLIVVCAQGLLDDGRRASTIAMGLNKQDKDHLVVRQIEKRDNSYMLFMSMFREMTIEYFGYERLVNDILSSVGRHEWN